MKNRCESLYFKFDADFLTLDSDCDNFEVVNDNFLVSNPHQPARYKPNIQRGQKVNKRVTVKQATEHQIKFENVEVLSCENINENLKFEKAKIKKVKGPVENEEISVILSYNQMMFEPVLKNPLKISSPVQFRISETRPECWGLEAEIADVVYEHALLQNVDFEWGTWARPVRSAISLHQPSAEDNNALLIKLILICTTFVLTASNVCKLCLKCLLCVSRFKFLHQFTF